MKFVTFLLAVLLVCLGTAVAAAAIWYWPGDQPVVSFAGGVMICSGVVAFWEALR